MNIQVGVGVGVRVGVRVGVGIGVGVRVGVGVGECASRHNGVHFFDITTSKSAPNVAVFGTFYCHMCVAPQRHALFQPLNFQKSGAAVF